MKTINFILAIIGLGLFTQVATASDLRKLTAEWWQWTLSIPTSNNPLLDSTGVHCMVGQRGSVWFLAGTYDGSKATRECHIPKGVKLLVPLFNISQYNSPNVCGQDENNLTVKQMRENAAPIIDGVKNISLMIDGKEVSNIKRVKSVPFAVAFPEASLANDVYCKDYGGNPAGVYGPAIDDGYYALVRVGAGIHKLVAHAESADGLFVEDNTYTLIAE